MAKHQPDVLVFDIAVPYEANWDFVDAVKMMPAIHRLPLVLNDYQEDTGERFS